MKKIINSLYIIMMVFILLIATSCSSFFGERVGVEIDKNKTQIFVSAYDGGNGTEWLEQLANEWNEGNDKYQVIINPGKISTANIIGTIKSGADSATTPSIYYTGEPGFQELVYGNYLENLEDMLTLKLDGEEGGTLREKMCTSESHYDEWKVAASQDGEGMYMLPFSDNFGLMVFDYQNFVDNNFLLYADSSSNQVKTELDNQGIGYQIEGNRLTVEDFTGDYKYFNYDIGDEILTCGKDGIYGSYDDGQPQTLNEFRTLINKIVSSNNGSKAFMWTSIYSGYVDMITNAVMCQYIGLEENDTYFNYNGSITVDGTPKNITVENGYEVYGNDGFRKGIEFLDEFFNNRNYCFSQSTDGSISHTEAQSYFILGYKLKQENQEFGNILVDGEWFEKEAAAAFKSVEIDGRGMGQRDYRILFLPNFEGQKGIDGNGNGSVVSVLNNGSIIVPKQKDSDKLEAIKDFIGYTLKDTSLQAFTVNTGAFSAYRYDITDEQYNMLTPYGQNCYQIHKDTQNVYFSRFKFRLQTNLLKISSPKMGSSLPVRIGGAQVVSTIAAFKRTTSNDPVTEIVNGSKNYYSTSTWQEILAAARSNGFYQ